MMLLTILIEASQQAEANDVRLELLPSGIRCRALAWDAKGELGQYKKLVSWVDLSAEPNVLRMQITNVAAHLKGSGYILADKPSVVVTA